MMKKKGMILFLIFFLALSGCQKKEEEAVPEKPSLVILEEEEEGDYNRAADQKIQVTEAKSSLLYDVREVKKKEKNYTVMVYIVGSNLESRYGAASRDIEEMEEAGLDFEKNNLLVYTGGSKRWNSDISNDSNSVLDLSEKGEKRLVAKTSETADMGASLTLSSFINYCTEHYPAKHYALILWDHGGGPLWGYGSDELFGNDSLVLSELKDAMEKTDFAKGKKLDIVGYDACLMGSLESAVLWKDYAEYLVSSEEIEAGNGWDYSFLHILNDTDDPEEIVREIVSAFGTFYEENRSEFFSPDVTLSALDLSKTDAAMEAVDSLFSAMEDGISRGDYASYNKARSLAKAFGLSASDSKYTAYDLLDLFDLCSQLQPFFPEETEAVKEAVEDLVVSSVTNVEGASGVSFYFPGDNTGLYEVAKELSPEGISEGYRSFVDAYTGEWLKDPLDIWDFEEMKIEGDEITLQLTKQQAENTSQAFYTILLRNEFGGFAIALANVRIEADEEGILHIPKDPYLITAKSDLVECVSPWAFLQVEDINGSALYRTLRVYLSSGHEFTDPDPDIDEKVTVTLRNQSGTSDTSIQDITSTGNGVGLAGKGSIDVSHYSSIIDTGSISYTPQRDSRGRMLPFSSWKSGGYVFYPMAIDSSFRFVMKPASDFDFGFICQVTVRDINGSLHASDYINLPKTDKITKKQVRTVKGQITYAIYDDHAELIGYEGEDEELVLSSQVAGLPVTLIGHEAFLSSPLKEITIPEGVKEIGDYAFANAQDLSEVVFPSTLEAIGMKAFASCGSLTSVELPEGLLSISRAAFMDTGLVTVDIPASVTYIGTIPFCGCESLTEILVDSANQNYKSVDGVLFSKDGKRLIEYPYAKGNTYSIPEGTETIEYGAFAEVPVEKVDFPEGLLEIRNDAFYNCTSLTEIVLPESLEVIDELAFGTMHILASIYGTAPVESVTIGKNIRYIGNEAFSAIGLEEFIVDEENEVYASSGGFLTNKAKDTILMVPRNMGTLIVIPEGITTLQKSIFDTLEDWTHFIIPDSCFRFSKKIFPYGYDSDPYSDESTMVFRAYIHASEGSAAEEYAGLFNIAYDHNTDPEDIIYEEAIDEKDGQHILYRVYKKHAEVAAISSDTRGDEILIPSSYNGVPVTGIVYGDYEASSQISADGSFRKITIPKSVEKIEARFFTDLYSLEEIEIEEGNEHFEVRDGVLFEGDVLVAMPERLDVKKYDIPEGTVSIGPYAFYLQNSLEEVSIPSSVVTIGENAFASIWTLRTVSFSEGLKEVGPRAFSSSYLEDVRLPDSIERIGNSAFYVGENFGEIVLPKNLKNIGYSGFSGDYRTGSAPQEVLYIPKDLKLSSGCFYRINTGSYEVDPENPYYTSEDGLIYTKDGKILVMVPPGRSGELHLPEGLENVEYSAFENCDLITDIYLPDSLVYFGSFARKNYETGEYYYTVHFRKGSEAEKYFETRDIPYEVIR